MAKTVLCVALVALAVVAPVAASSAWSDFVGHVEPVVTPQEHSRRLMAGASNAPSFIVQSSKANKPAFQTTVTVNSYIQSMSNDTTSADANKLAVFALCNKHSAGARFASTVQNAFSSSPTDPDAMPPGCSYCLTQGYGTTDDTPGFYLPCGCSNTCVDVSGNLKGNWARLGQPLQDNTGALTADNSPKVFPAAANAGVDFAALDSCSAFIQNQMIYECKDLANYHYVLWPSLIAVLAAIYTAYSMAYMQLDMDSLLYTVGSGSKKDQ